VTDDSGGLVGLINEYDDTNNALNSGLVLTIFGANGPPEIASMPVTTAIVGQQYRYDVESTDSDAGQVVTFTLEVSPAGMTIDPATGLMQWTPVNAQVGDIAVTVRVEDNSSRFDTQTFTVTVIPMINAPPTWTAMDFWPVRIVMMPTQR
jgi:hypothetical protein